MNDQERIEQLEAELDETRMVLNEYRQKWALLIIENVAYLSKQDRAYVANRLSKHEKQVLRKFLEELP